MQSVIRAKRVLLLIVLLALPVILTVSSALAFQVEPPEPDWIDLLTTFGTSLSLLAVAIVSVSEWLIGKVLKWNGFPAWLGTILVGEALSLLGWFTGMGMYAHLELWWHSLLVGLGGVLIAIGLFSAEVVKSLLEKINIRVPQKAQPR